MTQTRTRPGAASQSTPLPPNEDPGGTRRAGGIAAISGSQILTISAQYASGSVRAWGWVMTFLSAVQPLAVAALWTRNRRARWLAVTAAGLTATGQMFFIPADPFRSLLIIAADVAAVWVLCARGSRENLSSG